MRDPFENTAPPAPSEQATRGAAAVVRRKSACRGEESSRGHRLVPFSMMGGDWPGSKQLLLLFANANWIFRGLPQRRWTKWMIVMTAADQDHRNLCWN